MKKFLSLALLLFAAPAAGQELVFGPEVELEEPADGFARPAQLMEAGADHLYFLALADDAVLQYSKRGKLVRQIGGKGEGPGEYLSPKAVVEAAGGVYIFCPGRVHRFGTDGTYDRSWGVPVNARDAVHIGGDVFLVQANSGTPESAGKAIHRLDLNTGRISASYDEFTYYSRQPGKGDRHLEASGSRVFSLPRFYEYAIRVFDLEAGTEAQTIVGDRWFDPYEYRKDFGPDQPPQSQVLGAWVEGGKLYVFGISPDPRWRDALTGEKQDSGEGVIYRVDPAKGRLFQDSHLDVYLAETGELLLAKDYDDGIGWLSHGYVQDWTEDDLGFWSGMIQTITIE